MTSTDQLTQDILSEEEQKWEEEWELITSTKGKYTLSKMQALVVKQALALGNRSTIPFETFVVAIPYIVEFYRTKRYLKDVKQLPAQAQEKEYVPIPAERWEEIKKQAYAKIGKEVPGAKRE